MSSGRPHVLLIAPYFDRKVPGESWSTFKWVEGISARCEATVLTTHRDVWDPAGSPTEALEVVNWTDPDLPGMKGRLAWELKPGYPFFYNRARRWIRDAVSSGARFDLIHQINPLALRYPSPAEGFGIPFIVGPLAGSLKTPEGFGDAARERTWFRKLRGLDRFRIARDPWLRKTYSRAAAILGVAPYVEELLQPCEPARFELMAETGVEAVADTPVTGPKEGEPLRLLFAGRIIRTKGIIDGIRALARCDKSRDIRLDVLGVGDMLNACRAEVKSLGLDDKVTFHGRVSRDEVFEWYRRSHIFLFPSFREPSGNVVFEAMSQGLPVVTTDVGGPGYVVNDDCGVTVTPSNPDSFPDVLAKALNRLAADPSRIEVLSNGALDRMRSVALWPKKIDSLMDLYSEVIGNKTGASPVSQLEAAS